MGWTSITDYCQGNAIAAAAANAAALTFPESTRDFLAALGDLPTLHPFCDNDDDDVESRFASPSGGGGGGGVPPMGALEHRFEEESMFEQLVTLWFMVAPPLLAMAELWLRLFAGIIANLGCIYLLTLWIFVSSSTTTTSNDNCYYDEAMAAVMKTKGGHKSSSSSSEEEDLLSSLSNTIIRQRGGRRSNNRRTRRLGWVCILTVASALVLMTDTYYVLNNGPVVGVLIFGLSLGLAVRTAVRYHLTTVAVALWMLVLLAIHLVWDHNNNSNSNNSNNNSNMNNHSLKFGSPMEQVDPTSISEGLYFDASTNPFIQSVVNYWPEHSRTYSVATGATPWMPSGDSRTGIPFLIHHWPDPDWYRVFLRTLPEQENDEHEHEEEKEEEEYVALDIAFPPNGGFQKSLPVYMILHGLNGGSAEEYIRDFTFRRLEEGCTVVVMIARGLMDLPVRGWNIFHGARTSDAHAAAMALQKVLVQLGGVDPEEPPPPLIGVGFSMGAIVLSNYVASYGKECALDGAISLSGGLDMRFQENFERAKRLWQPMLAETLRSDFLLGKWGKRVQARLSKDEMLRMMRATHITEIDRYAVVPYNGFRDLRDYYASMSALGDIPMNKDGLLEEENNGKIHSVAIPLCVVHSFDDPLVTWRATASNKGFMHPENLVKSGNGNVMLLLTKAGGHVGWPLGVVPIFYKWKWMSDVAMTFGQAVASAKRIHYKKQHTHPAIMETLEEDADGVEEDIRANEQDDSVQ